MDNQSLENSALPEKKESICDEKTHMIALGLPAAFGNHDDECSDPKNHNLPDKEFTENEADLMGGNVECKMEHIRSQDRLLRSRGEKRPRPLYFDGEGGPIPEQKGEENRRSILPECSEDEVSSAKKDRTTTEQSNKQIHNEECDVGIPMKRRREINIPPEIKTNPELKKYWKRRYYLFRRFDEGIKLDEESWYSVTPELVAKHTAEKCKSDVIIDAFCGAGGNAIQFALTCKKVIAIDIDPKKIELAKNNAAVYGVADKIDFIVGDYISLAPNLKADTVFLSPPWGGPSYVRSTAYDLETMLQPIPFSKLMDVTRNISENIAAFLPKNSNKFQVWMHKSEKGSVDIEHNISRKRFIGITAYYNDFTKKLLSNNNNN